MAQALKHTANFPDRIKQNASTSPLLLLPAEIRERILTFLLGGRRIHIRHLRERSYCDRDSTRFYASWCLKDSAFPPDAIEYSKFHEKCLPSPDVMRAWPLEDPKQRAICRIAPHLLVMGVCRQLYVEAHQLLWSSNTFFFDCPVITKTFLASLNSIQKGKLSHLQMACTWGTLYEWPYQICSWTFLDRVSTRISSSHLLGLRNVQNLDIFIQQGWSYRGHNQQGVFTHDSEWPRCLDSLKSLRAIKSKQVSVRFSTNTSVESSDPELRITSNSLTITQRKEYAQTLEEILVEPEGLEKQQSEEKERRLKSQQESLNLKDDNEFNSIKRALDIIASRQSTIRRYKKELKDLQEAKGDPGTTEGTSTPGTEVFEHLSLKNQKHIHSRRKLLEEAKKSKHYWEETYLQRKARRDERLAKLGRKDPEYVRRILSARANI